MKLRLIWIVLLLALPGVATARSKDLPATKSAPPVEALRWKPPIFLCIKPASPSIDADIVREMKHTLVQAAEVWNAVSGAEITVLFAGKVGRCDRPQRVFLNDNGRHFASGELISGLSGFSAADRLGVPLADGGELHFATEYAFKDSVCGPKGIAGASACRFGDAVHEIGHLLGFSHDHVSKTAPSCYDMAISHEQKDVQETYYDAKSVMNYCNVERWRGQLSPADICSVNVAYPKTGSEAIYTRNECYKLAETSGAGEKP